MVFDKSNTARFWIALAAVLLAAVLAPGAFGQQATEKNSDARTLTMDSGQRSVRALLNEEQAVTKAREIAGLLGRELPRFTPQLTTLAQDNTPFLKNQIVGRPIWHIVITDWKLELASRTSDVKDKYSRTFDLFLDPQNGSVLKVSSRWPQGVRPIKPEPPADFAEERMAEAGREKYHGFPDEPPSISLLQALDVIARDGVGDPLEAKQIVAHYVVRSAMGGEPKPVWAITLRGITPLKAAYPGVSEDARNHIRNIIDGQTGKWVCAGTSPQPEG